jgi:hypothetical protein
MAEDTMRVLLVNAIKARAMFYYAFYKELSGEVGPEKAAQIMRRAVYKRGLKIGERFRQFAPNDMEGLKTAFLNFVPDPQATFDPEIQRCDEAGLDIALRACPLKDAWFEAGLSDDEIVLMTDIAGQVDKGTFEGAGFVFDTDTWRPGREGCCRLRVRPAKQDR